jgi:hypothetical protein
MPFSLSVFCKNKWPKCKKHKRRSFCSYFIQLKCTTFYCIGFIDGHKIETNFAFFLEQSTRHDFSVRVCLSLSLFQFKSSNSVDNPIKAWTIRRAALCSVPQRPLGKCFDIMTILSILLRQIANKPNLTLPYLTYLQYPNLTLPGATFPSP